MTPLPTPEHGEVRAAAQMPSAVSYNVRPLSGSAWETRQCGYRHLSQSLNSGVAPLAVGRLGEPWRHLVAVDASR
jgi:hypothetical protein